MFGMISRNAGRLLCSLAVAVSMSAVSGCDIPGQHLSFKGIPMKGSVERFEKKLAKKGYEIDEYGGEAVNLMEEIDEDSVHTGLAEGLWDMSGGPLGPTASICLFGTDISNTIYQILVEYSPRFYCDGDGSVRSDSDFKNYINENFLGIVHLYEQKYGKTTYTFFPSYNGRGIPLNQRIDFDANDTHDGRQHISEERLVSTLRIRDGIAIASFDSGNGIIRIALRVKLDSDELIYHNDIFFLYRDAKNSKLVKKEYEKHKKLVNKRNLDNI